MEEAGGSGGNDAFIRWLTTIIDEIDSTADTLKDEANTVKVRKITPNLEILTNELRAGNARARKNAVIGLDDAIATAIKNLQNLRTHLKEEARQLFNLPVDRMEASQMFCSTKTAPGASGLTDSYVFDSVEYSDRQNIIRLRSPAPPLESSLGGTETENRALSGIGGAHCEDDTSGGSDSNAAASDIENLTGNRRGGNGEVEATPPPKVPVPEPVAGCSSNAQNDGPVSKYQKTNEIGFEGCHDARSSPLSVIPSSSNDQDPRDLLSAECWQLVFDKVDDPQDWLNLYRTSSYFQEVVGEKRTTALFPQVARDVIPYLGENLDDLLGLRLVCRSWKTGVDNLLGNADWYVTPGPGVGVHLAPIQSEFPVRQRLRWQLEESYEFGNPARISSFLERFDETHAGNPFVGRFAFFRYYFCRRSRVIGEYIILASQLLDKFGAHLRTLRVAIGLTSFDNVVTQLDKCLQLVPKLEYLRVQCYNDRWEDRTGPGGEWQLHPCISANELLPLLPDLRSISFSIGGGTALAGILGLQNAVVRLSCNPTSLESVETLGFPSALDAFPNLKSAEVILYAVEYCSNLPITPWPLSKLTLWNFLSIPSSSGGGGNLLLFNSVEIFKATLTSLRFVFPLANDPVVKLKLDLPHLKKLAIDAGPSLSLEYFTNLTNLEVLCISHAPFSTNNTTTTLPKLIDYIEAEVVRCRLWESLPRLTKICLFGAARDQITGGSREVCHVATRRIKEFKRDENRRMMRRF